VVEKEHLRELLTKLLAFSVLEMMTFCLRGTHFQFLLGVLSERESLEAMSDQPPGELAGPGAESYSPFHIRAPWIEPPPSPGRR
jgi:hypothetical protein